MVGVNSASIYYPSANGSPKSVVCRRFGGATDANHFDLFLAHLSLLRNGKTADRPIYERATGEANSTVGFTPRRFVVLDDEIAICRHLRIHIDFSIFIDSDWKTHLSTRSNRHFEMRDYSGERAITEFRPGRVVNEFCILLKIGFPVVQCARGKTNGNLF